MSSGVLGSLSSAGSFGSAGLLGSAEDPFAGLGGSIVGGELDEAFGAGGLGLSGIGGGGGGTGEGTIGLGSLGTIGSGSGKPVPKVKLGKSVTASGLDKDVARRIVRAHINEARTCYREGLEDKEGASGAITLELSVDASGKVTSAAASGDTVAAGVGSCLTKKARRWRFPKPKGSATVEFSLTFSAV